MLMFFLIKNFIQGCNMHTFCKLACACFFIPLVTACSHNIQISPPLDELRSITIEPKIDKSIAYYMPAALSLEKVTTPGGGGDKISYQPYKDTEGALNTMLSQAFSRVYRVSDLNDKANLENKNISLIFHPTIKTFSSSSSPFTWPATDFTFELTCQANNREGQLIWEKTVVGKGQAEFDEFKHDFALSSRRAVEQAFKEMLLAIKQSPELNAQ